MPSEELKKAVKDGLITQKQYDKMPEALLLGIVKRGGNGGKKMKSSKKKGKKGGK
jgi:predicted RNA-binding protein associated with RNAse of E/G family